MGTLRIENHSINILLVSEDRALPDVLGRILVDTDLKECRFQLLSFKSLLSDEIKDRNPDIVLLDLRQSDRISDANLCSAKQKFSRIPVIVLLDRDGKEHITESLGDSVQDYLVDGNFDAEIVVRSIRYAIRLKRLDVSIKDHKIDLLRAVVGEIPDILFVKDLDNRYLFVNLGGAAQLGKTPAEVIGRSNEELMSPESASLARESDQTVIQSGKPRTAEMTITSGKITRRYFVTKSPYRDLNGKIVGVIGIGRDVTEQRAAEEKFQSETAIRNAIERAMLAGVAALDKSGKLIYVNTAFSNMVGWREEELLGKTPPFPYWVPDKTPENLKSVNSRLTTGNTSEFRTEFQKKSGERFPVLIKTAPLTDGYGKDIGFVATVSNITAQKAAEDKVLENYNLLKTITEGTDDAIYLRNLDDNYLMINSSAARYFGKTPEEIIGKNLSDFFPVDSVEKIKLEDRKSLESGKTCTYEHTLLIDGNEFTFLTSRGPIRNLNNEITGFFGVSHDITDRKKREENQIRSEKLESLGFLAGGIAHDFNNILTAVMGNISLAKAQVAHKDGLSRILDEAQKASLRAKELSNQLLTFSKGGNPHKITTSISNVLVESSEFILRGTNVKARFNIQKDLWQAEVDEGQIGQVIQNLVINAMQSMPQGGTIEIQADNYLVVPGNEEDPVIPEGKYIRIRVIDEGTGIPIDSIQRIFDPYFTTKEKGSGLGLAIAYSIIKRHNGTISVKSAPGKGSAFTIFLPAFAGISAGTIKFEKDLRPGKGRILIMDDEEAVLKTGGDCLKYLGYQVDFATEGGEAVSKYKQALASGKPFDLVILDLTVPAGISGQETIRRLIEIDPGVRGIVSSGYSDSIIMSEYQKFGFVGKISKPYRIEDLSEALSKAANPDPSRRKEI